MMLIHRRLILATALLLLAPLARAQPLPPPTPGAAAGGVAPYVATTAGVANLTGTSSETNLAALKIPANTIGKNGVAEIYIFASYTNSSNNKTITGRITNIAGSTTGGGVISAIFTTTASAQMLLIISNNNATNAQVWFAAPAITPFAQNVAAPGTTLNVDTTQDTYVNINGVLALSTETITLQHAYVVVYPSKP
jgi:hypothetical protein